MEAANLAAGRSATHPSLSDLIISGDCRARVHFGGDGAGVPIGQLSAAGASHFGEGADGDRAGLLMTNDRPTVELIVGALATGTKLVSLPLPGRGADLEAYLGFLRAVCVSHQLSEIVAADEFADILGSAGLAVRAHSELGGRPVATPTSSGCSLVQFTSGSTGQPRPVELDDAALGANVGAILRAVQPQPGDVAVSWLPLAHDMGLIGMLLASIAAGQGWDRDGIIVLLNPQGFLRRPHSWLETIDHWRGTFTAAPDFAYRMSATRQPPTQLDLSSLRCAIVGGEIVRAETLTAFEDTYRPHGFDDLALCPAYGLAELGLAATLTATDERWQSRSLSVDALAEDRVDEAREADVALHLVASGRPLDGYEVRPASAGSEVAPLRVLGPSIGLDAMTGESLADADGWLSTGDIGFVDDGLLYVCGRADDYVVVQGRRVYAPAVERAVGKVEGVRAGRVMVTGLPTGHWALAVEQVERDALDHTRVERLRRQIRQAAVGVANAKPDHVVVLEHGQMPLTSSGKLQRNRLRQKLMDGSLTGSGVLD